MNEEIRKSEYRFGTILGISNLPIFNANSKGKWRVIRY
jgi:hypothetical protein